MTVSTVPSRIAPQSLAVSAAPRIGLALGGGGARGIAHILILEAIDELGLKVHRLAGTSIGAIYGAAYGSGLPAKLLRAHTEEVLGGRLDLMRQLFAARAQPSRHWLNLLPIRSALLDPLALLDILLPSKVAHDFADLKIPLDVVATDFYGQEQTVFNSGALRPAVAGSMALPALFAPVAIDGIALVDGGLVNPLPFDLLAANCDLTIAIDVSGSRALKANGQPTALDVLLASSQIFQRTIVREKLRVTRPDIYIDCPVDKFTLLDFHKFKDILEISAPIKDQLKRQLDLVLSSQTVDLLPVPTPETAADVVASPNKPSRRDRATRSASDSLAKAKALLPRSGKGKPKTR
jgi:NTE family protein